jgi:hypothetical protein
MKLFKCAVLGALSLAAIQVCSAQHKFPLSAGEWEATLSSSAVTGDPTVLRYCLNDELWTKAMTQNPSCTVSLLSVTPIGASYSLDCQAKSYTMTAKITMAFDGMNHMTSKGTIEMTMGGKTTPSTTQTDWRWKGPTCNPTADINLRVKNRPH